MNSDAPLPTGAPLVIGRSQVDASPSYVIVGGLVFLELSLPLIDAGLFETIADPTSTGCMLTKVGGRRRLADEKVLLLASILESELTISARGAAIELTLSRQPAREKRLPVFHRTALSPSPALKASTCAETWTVCACVCVCVCLCVCSTRPHASVRS